MGMGIPVLNILIFVRVEIYYSSIYVAIYYNNNNNNNIIY